MNKERKKKKDLINAYYCGKGQPAIFRSPPPFFHDFLFDVSLLCAAVLCGVIIIRRGAAM
jgi:hypothetical protein